MEFPNVGTQCGVKDCAQLDFLPTECVYCHQIFCTHHHNPPEAHSCANIPNKVLTDAEVAAKEKSEIYKCTYANCNVKEVVLMNCSECGQHYCLNHRHANQHDCPSLTRIQEESDKINQRADQKQASTKQVQAQLQQQIASSLKEAQAAGGHKSAMATKLALMKLKGRAKGDNAVPVGERVFFSIECPNKQQNPKPLDLFLSKRWSMGKIIDVIAREARIKNRNNQAEAPKLHLFKGETCLTKPSDKIFSELLESGIVTDGDELVFKYLDE